MKLLLHLFVSFVFLSPIAAQEGSLSGADPVVVWSKEGTLTAAVQRASIQWSDAKGEARTAAMKSLFIPTKRLAWVGSANYQYFFLLGDKMVGLKPADGPELWMCYFTTNLSSSVDWRAALNAYISRRLQKLSENPNRSDYILYLRKVFGVQTFINESTWRMTIVPTIDAVTFENQNAVLHLHILGEIFTVELDKNLEIVAVSQAGRSVALHERLFPCKLTSDTE